MKDEVDASNDSDMGDDMDEFYGMKNVIFCILFLHPPYYRLVVCFQTLQMV